jgi:hypothetical protein
MSKKLKELYIALNNAMNSGRIDEEYLQYIDRLQDEIQALENQTQESMQQLSILSVYHVPSLEKLYIKVVDVDGPRFVLELVEYRQDASVFNQDQVKELLEDFRSNNQDISYFVNEKIHSTKKIYELNFKIYSEIRQGLVEFHKEII